MVQIPLLPTANGRACRPQPRQAVSAGLLGGEPRLMPVLARATCHRRNLSRRKQAGGRSHTQSVTIHVLVRMDVLVRMEGLPAPRTRGHSSSTLVETLQQDGTRQDRLKDRTAQRRRAATLEWQNLPPQSRGGQGGKSGTELAGEPARRLYMLPTAARRSSLEAAPVLPDNPSTAKSSGGRPPIMALYH